MNDQIHFDTFYIVSLHLKYYALKNIFILRYWATGAEASDVIWTKNFIIVS